ncbi:MAG: ankyrin repeat domain-containing protein [Bryobacteraceae bacterium]|nr:ankyrin repeat domain-containing protein [Bryobacteraceae bacterium]
MKELFEAIRAGDLGRVSELLHANATLANARDEHGHSAFTAAVYHGQNAIADLLEERGAVVDVFAAAMSGRTGKLQEVVNGNRSWLKSFSADGWTPLHLAAYFGHRDAALFLIGKGADVHVRSTNSLKNTPLHAAAAGRHLELVKLLIAAGAAVSDTQHGGFTALHAAAQGGDLEIAEALLNAGADPAIQDDSGQTPRDLAVTHGHLALAEILERQA